MSSTQSSICVYFFFPETEARRFAISRLEKKPDESHVSRYFLMGIDILRKKGYKVSCNLESPDNKILDRLLCFSGRLWFSVFMPSFNGRWYVIRGGLEKARNADVVFAFTDAIGIPLLALRKIGVIKSRIVYVSVGLPERIKKLGGWGRSVAMSLFAQAETIVAYSNREAEEISKFIGSDKSSDKVRFISFGVDTDVWKSDPSVAIEYDVACVGGDPNRDIETFYETAKSLPLKKFALVTTKYISDQNPSPPDNVKLFCDIPIADVKDILNKSKLVALPVLENSYSGATTTLLQSMSLEKPVVLSETVAVTNGYELTDGVNCFFVDPGDTSGFTRKVESILNDEEIQNSVGKNGRATVLEYHSWSRFVDNLIKCI